MITYRTQQDNVGTRKLKKAVIQIREQQRRKDMKCSGRLKLVEVSRQGFYGVAQKYRVMGRQLVTWVYEEKKRISMN